MTGEINKIDGRVNNMIVRLEEHLKASQLKTHAYNQIAESI